MKANPDYLEQIMAVEMGRNRRLSDVVTNTVLYFAVGQPSQPFGLDATKPLVDRGCDYSRSAGNGAGRFPGLPPRHN